MSKSTQKTARKAPVNKNWAEAPENISLPELKSIPTLLLQRAAKHPKMTALRVKREGRYQDICWQEYKERACEAAAALLHLGLERGEAVAMMLANRPEFAYSDLGALMAGGVGVAIYTNTMPQGIAYILNHCEARFLIVDTVERYEKVREIASELEHLKYIFLIEKEKSIKKIPGLKLQSFDDLCEIGREAKASDDALIARSMEKSALEETAILIYTSGTTGPPKGAMLSHRNLSFICATMAVSTTEITEHETFISFLPLAHALERIGCLYFAIYNGGTIGFAERLETVAQDILEIRPTVLYGVPRFFEKIFNGVIAAAAKGGTVKRKVFEWALSVGREAGKKRSKGKKLGPILRIKYWLAHRLVFKKLHERLGGRVKHIVSGGAPLSAAISEFFYNVGMPIMEAYGATETSAPSTITRPDSFRIGTVGVPIPGVQVKIVEDGEILIRGDNVCKGYFKDAEATARAFADGWYHTGDIGRFDEEGNLVITDRKKDIIITSAGKNIAPQNIENLLKTSPYINQAMVYGDRRKYLTALITLDMESIKPFAAKEGLAEKAIAELAQDKKIYKLIENEVAAKNKELASYEQIKKFVVVDREFSVESGELTPTLKVKRKVVTENYKDLLDSLYEKEFSSSLVE